MSNVVNCPEWPPLRGYFLAGFALVVIFFGGGLLWASLAPLASAAIAAGSVNLDTYRKTVQHLEGGLVAEITVREGQEVSQGEVLLKLDETQVLARIELIEAQIESEKKQLSYLAEEIEGLETLMAGGLVSKSRLLELYRRRAELEGSQTEHLAELDAAIDIVDRSQIRAPITGTIVGLAVHTIGAVIKPGEALLSIVPKDEPLVVEAQIDLNDIDVIDRDLPAQVRLTPFNARVIPPLPGRIIWISADRIADQATGEGYYLARIEIAATPEELPDGVELYPGMPAEVLIPTGEQTFLDYLVAPISRSLRRAFREQ
jgi:multidrug efflux pump subunit AcrA (membrane-fusion protein)